MKRSPMPPRRTPLKRTGKPRFPDGVDEAYRAWIRTLPCCIPGSVRVGGSEPAHVKSRGASGPDHGNLVPLCRFHHDQLHSMGCTSFPAKYGIDLKAIALQLDKDYTRALREVGL